MLLHLCVAGTLFATFPSGWMAVLLCVVVGGSAWHAYHRYYLRRGSLQIRRAVWLANGRWVLEVQAGNRFEVRLLSNSFSSQRIVILNFSAIRDGVNYSVVILQDSVPAAVFRQIRMRLRILPFPVAMPVKKFSPVA